MQSIYTLIPDHEILLGMEPEELAGFVLQLFNSSGTKERRLVSPSYIISNEMLRNYPREHQTDITYALVEAVVWLKNDGLLAEDPGQRSSDWLFITRQGRKLSNAVAVETYRKTKLLPKDLLHSALVDKVWPLFSRGNYDTAVLQAFKTVEVAVRNAGEYTKEDCDVELMEKAFHPDSGKLRLAVQTEREKQAILALFSGAMGLYKEPFCHQDLDISAEKASEAIIFASHLLKIVDSIISESTPFKKTD